MSFVYDTHVYGRVEAGYPIHIFVASSDDHDDAHRSIASLQYTETKVLVKDGNERISRGVGGGGLKHKYRADGHRR